MISFQASHWTARIQPGTDQGQPGTGQGQTRDSHGQTRDGQGTDHGQPVTDQGQPGFDQGQTRDNQRHGDGAYGRSLDGQSPEAAGQQQHALRRPDGLG